jgi:hypothetical protein
MFLQGGWDAAAMGLVRFYYTKSGIELWNMGRGCGIGMETRG